MRRESDEAIIGLLMSCFAIIFSVFNEVFFATLAHLLIKTASVLRANDSVLFGA